LEDVTALEEVGDFQEKGWGVSGNDAIQENKCLKIEISNVFLYFTLRITVIPFSKILPYVTNHLLG